jgi:5-methylcytosine-specific restriction endonuclease McrA
VRQADIDALCRRAVAAWDQASRDARHVRFLWRGKRYSSHLTTFRICIKSREGLPVASCFHPDTWWEHAEAGGGVLRTRGTIAPALRFRILKRDGYRCRLCGAAARDGEHVKLHVDHIVAKSTGGTDDPSNLWTLCRTCNIGKGIQDL